MKDFFMIIIPSLYKTKVPESTKWNDAKYILSFKQHQTDIHGNVSCHFLIPSQNIPSSIEALGEMPLENNGMQDNTSKFVQNYSVETLL